jgi:activator of HSP90 ATPase
LSRKIDEDEQTVYGVLLKFLSLSQRRAEMYVTTDKTAYVIFDGNVVDSVCLSEKQSEKVLKEKRQKWPESFWTCVETHVVELFGAKEI